MLFPALNRLLNPGLVATPAPPDWVGSTLTFVTERDTAADQDQRQPDSRPGGDARQ
jgi:hypothetical protein